MLTRIIMVQCLRQDTAKGIIQLSSMQEGTEVEVRIEVGRTVGVLAMCQSMVSSKRIGVVQVAEEGDIMRFQSGRRKNT